MEESINGSSDIQKIELIIATVSKNKTKWKGLGYGSKLAYLKSIHPEKGVDKE
jgi:hypothetical protein